MADLVMFFKALLVILSSPGTLRLGRCFMATATVPSFVNSRCVIVEFWMKFMLESTSANAGPWFIENCYSKASTNISAFLFAEYINP